MKTLLIIILLLTACANVSRSKTYKPDEPITNDWRHSPIVPKQDCPIDMYRDDQGFCRPNRNNH